MQNERDGDIIVETTVNMLLQYGFNKEVTNDATHGTVTKVSREGRKVIFTQELRQDATMYINDSEPIAELLSMALQVLCRLNGRVGVQTEVYPKKYTKKVINLFD